MTRRVGPKGQVVIPKEMRDRLGIKPGDEVNFQEDAGSVKVIPVRDARDLRGRFRGSGMAAELLAARRAEELRDAQR